MSHIPEMIRESVTALEKRLTNRPRAALVLGTGLGGVAEEIVAHDAIPFSEIPHFSESTVESHKGQLVVGTIGGIETVAMQGRYHYYEGHDLSRVTFPVRVMRALGAEILIINSAAGGLNPDFESGDVMLLTDHINFIGANPLRGMNDDTLGERFPDMTKPYDEQLGRHAQEAATELDIRLRSGVYVAVSGPSLETRAESRMLRNLGADAVGMSTVPEVIVAVQVGFRVLALAAITNVNIPDAMEPVSIERVLENASLAEPKLSGIARYVLSRM